jgi:DNA replication and repair protein RecF
VTAIVGPNGAGKTNLLEAVHVGTQGFSPRTRRDTRVVRFGSAAAAVSARGVAGKREFETAVTIRPGQGKRIALDGATLPSTDELRRRFPVLAFTPDRLVVVKGGPIVRRAYLDRVLGRLLPARADLPGEYGRALAQRNAALRRAAAGQSSPATVVPWTEALARLGTELDAARAETVAALTEVFAAAAAALGLEEASLGYEARGLAVSELEERLDRDLARGTTGAGPHLQDLAIRAGARDLRAFGSQGEQRIAVLALLLAEARVIGDRRDEAPVLLLDDVLSELDDRRRSALLETIPAGCQTLVTATTLRSLPPGLAPELVVDVVPGKAVPR